MASWAKIEDPPMETMDFAEIMSEEYAQRVHQRELARYARQLELTKQEDLLSEKLIWCDDTPSSSTAAGFEQRVNTKVGDEEGKVDVPELTEAGAICDSDAIIAQMLQSQFDHEYNEELRRIEKQRNKKSKVTVTLDKFRRHGDLEFLNDNVDSYEDDYEEEYNKRDWDRFETNEKMLDAIPKCGFKVDKEGEMITKHDAELCGVRNACRVMSFPPEFPTGDGAGFDMKLSNKVFNQLKTYSRRGTFGKKSKMHDRKENVATAEMGVDAATRLLLYKLINNQILEQINGIISTGKEALILHANSDPAYVGVTANRHGTSGVVTQANILPKECAIKIFKTTLNEFKQRDRYIKDDYRFKDRFSKQNNSVIINMWAEKEMHNMMRMQNVGINCPDVIVLKKHVLVMSFIGHNHNAAPKLKDARLSEAELSDAYEEIISVMHKLYNEAKLVHADLSEYNILWHDGKCWFIDVAQSVEPEHPSALEFLMRDCNNIVNFFEKRGLPNVYTKEQLFEYITSLNAENHNVSMLERIHTRGASVKQATAPNQEDCPDELKPLNFPFDLAWEKAQEERHQDEDGDAAKAMQTLNIEGNDTANCETMDANKGQSNTIVESQNVATATAMQLLEDIILHF